jgi:hypothetical protein
MATEVVTAVVASERYVRVAHEFVDAATASAEATAWEKSGAKPDLRLRSLSDEEAVFEWVNSQSCGSSATIQVTLYRPDVETFNADRVRLADSLVLGDRRISAGSGEPSYGTHHQGDIVFNTLPDAGGTIGWVCVEPGTAGSYDDVDDQEDPVTVTAPGGSGVVTLSYESPSLLTGMYITIDGNSFQVIHVDGTMLAVDGNVGVGTGLAIAYDNPTFETFGAISGGG